MKKLILLVLFGMVVVLTGCSLFNKEKITVDGDIVVEMDKVIKDIDILTGETSEEEVTEKDSELQETVHDFIEERKNTLDEWDDLTEDDIELIEDILNELVEEVESSE